MRKVLPLRGSHLVSNLRCCQLVIFEAGDMDDLIFSSRGERKTLDLSLLGWSLCQPVSSTFFTLGSIQLSGLADLHFFG